VMGPRDMKKPINKIMFCQKATSTTDGVGA
jgi:hypothetical protein